MLESRHPPDEIRQYHLNWLHPTNFWADWSSELLERCIRESRQAIGDGETVLVPWVLWIHPAMNGLPNSPVKFDVGLDVEISGALLTFPSVAALYRL